MALLQNILLVLSCMLLIVLAIGSATKLNVPGISAMIAMIVFFIVWVVGDLIEANAPNFNGMLWGRNIQQIGVFFTPLCSLYFSIDYTSNKRMRVFAHVMTVLQTVSVILIFTDQSTHIMRRNIEVQTNAVFGQALSVVSTSVGSILVSVNFCLPVISLLVLSLFARVVSAKLRRPLWMVILSFFLTLLAAILQSTVFSGAGINIPIPILNLPCVMLLFYAVLQGGFLGIEPTAFHKVFEVIDQGIILLNAGGVVTEYNGRANELIRDFSGAHTLGIGSDISALLPADSIPLDKNNFLQEPLSTELSSVKGNLHVSLTSHPLMNPGKRPLGYVLVLTDITSLKKRAELDSLTGVYNREGLSNAFEMLRTHSDGSLSISAMIIDLDRFKTINDTYGHFAGDSVLLDFVQALQLALSGRFTIGRHGGDEFVVLFPAEADEAFALSEQVRIKIAERSLRYLNNEIQYTVSIGVASEKIQNTSLSDLLKKADQALYKAKEQGRNRTSRYGGRSV